MLLQVLKRLEPFRQLRAAELQTVSRHAQLLSLPAARWLLRPQRRLTGAYYLLRGRLQLWEPQRLLSAQDDSAQHPFYPGADAILTRCTVQILHIDTAPIEFLWAAVEQGGLQSPVPDDAWLSRFLGSPLLQHLDPAHWQQLLRSANERQVAAGEAVVQAGTLGDEFLCSNGASFGATTWHNGCLLGPGDFLAKMRWLLESRVTQPSPCRLPVPCWYCPNTNFFAHWWRALLVCKRRHNKNRVQRLLPLHCGWPNDRRKIQLGDTCRCVGFGNK